VAAEYGKRPGVTVIDVQFVKVSPRELTGFVKLKMAGLDDVEVMRPCNVTIGEDRRYIWHCD
jgi:hypothetical protein